MTDITYLGLTRFSVDPLSIIGRQKRSFSVRYVKEQLHKIFVGTTVDKRDLQTIRHILYNKRRLEQRISLFKSFPLASMAKLLESGHQIKYLIFCSTLLPPDILHELYQAIAPYKDHFKIVIISPRESFFEVCRVNSLSYATTDKIYSFRLDDDDGLSLDFIPSIQSAVKSCPPGTVISLDQGFNLGRVNLKFLLEPSVSPKIAIGLGVISSKIYFRTIYDEEYLHPLIPDNKVLNIKHKQLWIRTFHDFNDSTDTIKLPLEVTSSELRQLLGLSFKHLCTDSALNCLQDMSSTRFSNRKGAKILYYHQ